MGLQETTTTSRSLTGNERALLRCLVYFDIFRYPLTENELFQNAQFSGDRRDFAESLDRLNKMGLVATREKFLMLVNAPAENVSRRIGGNRGADAIYATAMRYCRKVAGFPFVRGICLSGALSKNYYDAEGDIDYFIIAQPGRLWICRTLLILRYKLMPRSKKKFWCVNYFVSSDNLAIPDRNQFTATELTHLVPAFNYSLYLDLLKANGWCRTYFPNREPRPDQTIRSQSPFKRMAEVLFTGWGGWLDDLLLRRTYLHWKRKFPEMNDADFDLQYRTRKNVCKRHHTGYQNVVLRKWNERIRDYEVLCGISLRH